MDQVYKQQKDNIELYSYHGYKTPHRLSSPPEIILIWIFSYWHVAWILSPLNPHDALKHNFASLKNGLISYT